MGRAGKRYPSRGVGGADAGFSGRGIGQDYRGAGWVLDFRALRTEREIILNETMPVNVIILSADKDTGKADLVGCAVTGD